MKKLFICLAFLSIVVSVASSCRGKRETCPAYGSKYSPATGIKARSI